MKSIYKVILGIWISTLSFSVLAIGAIGALKPAGLNAGDQFYVMFVTGDTRQKGNLTVDQYNAWVNGEADLEGIGPTAGLTWSILMNHESLDLSTGITTATEQTLSLFGANTAAPVYTVTGDLIASNRADLFDATIGTAINVKADRTALPAVALVWTGSDSTGAASSPLGNAASTIATEAIVGAAVLDGRWIDEGSPEPKSNVNHLYAVSPLLRVTDASIVPIIAPTAGNDSATVAEGASVDITVLANDSDVENALIISSVAVQSSPANGAAVVNSANGVITYTPNANFSGNDSFTYLVTGNNNANSNIATVSITVTAVASGGSSGAMDWSLLMLLSVLSLLRVKVRK